MAPRFLRSVGSSAAVLAAFAASACTGPTLRLDAPEPVPFFVDGVAAAPGELPFRYYGTTRWDAIPADVDGRADWTKRPTSGAVAVPAPAPGWLFPFDFPVELALRALHGRRDQTATVRVEPAVVDPRGETEIVNLELAGLAARARQARASR
jgi:hypothetical protein